LGLVRLLSELVWGPACYVFVRLFFGFGFWYHGSTPDFSDPRTFGEVTTLNGTSWRTDEIKAESFADELGRSAAAFLPRLASSLVLFLIGRLARG
jgi:hypothetical protein